MGARIAKAAAIALFTFLAMPAQAQIKIAYVDMQRALGEIEEGKVAKAQLKKRFDVKQQELDKRQDEIKRDSANLESLAREGVMKDDKLREKRAELEKKLTEVTQFWKESQEQISVEERRLTQEIFAKMASVIRTMAEADGYAFVFDRNESGLVYAPDSLDLTNELVRKYNQKYGSGGKGGGAKESAGEGESPAAKPKKK